MENTVCFFRSILKGLLLFFCFFQIHGFSQIDSTTTVCFDFNEHEIKEKNGKIIPRPEGITLTYDRFGNENSAIYLHGHNSSYLNLGSSILLKPKKGTIALWVKLERRVTLGKGYDNNPIIVTKNSKNQDFNIAYTIAYECYNHRFGTATSKDSTEEVVAYSKNEIKFNDWYHLVISFDNNYFTFYVNGELQQKFNKGFQTTYHMQDSVVIGHSASLKNERYSQGIFDDIQVFHRVLTGNEVKKLYNTPNPNKLKKIFNEILKYGIIIFILIGIIILLIFRSKRALKKQKEQFELINKITELELKVVKAQMNPHFISNCLAAIQELIYKNDIDKAGQYIAKFSYFLRQVLNYSDKNYITLVEEIEIIKLNVELEQLRFKNDFLFEIYVNKDINVEEVLIPSLITQPFIENAIWHGLLPLGNLRKPVLKINVFLEKGFSIIEIEDNGIGRNNVKKENKVSKGTKLVSDKIDNLNRLNQTTNYKVEIIDLTNNNEQIGTIIRIQLENI